MRADPLDRVLQAIADACERVGRDPGEVTLVAISKRQSIEAIKALYSRGVRDFGENQVQELVGKARDLGTSYPDIRWHFVGRLQRNKINALVAQPVHLIHSIDRADLVVALDKRADERGLEVLIQVNTGREEQKGGVFPEDVAALAGNIGAAPRLRLRGLMCIPPADQEPRPHFEELARCLDHCRREHGAEEAMELSMGMSSDFVVAVECGATMVRVGTALFGARPA